MDWHWHWKLLMGIVLVSARLVYILVWIDVQDWVLVLLTIDVVVDWILQSTKAQSSIKDSSAVLFVTLAKTWVLVKLRENLIQTRYSLRQALQFLLNRLWCHLLIFLDLIHQPWLMHGALTVLALWCKWIKVTSRPLSLLAYPRGFLLLQLLLTLVFLYFSLLALLICMETILQLR